jgi:hypothetical protein
MRKICSDNRDHFTIRHQQQYDHFGQRAWSGRKRVAGRGLRPNARTRHVRHGIAQYQHRRIRGLRYRQQSDHGSHPFGYGRIGLADWRVRPYSTQYRASGRPARASDGGLWGRQRRSRRLEYCSYRCRLVTAVVSDDTTARVTAVGRYCCKSLFALVIKNSPGCRRDFRVKMWGTSSPDDKLTGDLGNVIETTQIGGRRSDRLTAGNLSPGNFGLLQHNRHSDG